MTFVKRSVSPLKMEKDIKEARRILSLERGGTEADVREQFKLLVRANHPDGQQSPDYGGCLTMEKLIWAKDIMLKELKDV